jgi:hypothetical protein
MNGYSKVNTQEKTIKNYIKNMISNVKSNNKYKNYLVLPNFNVKNNQNNVGNNQFKAMQDNIEIEKKFKSIFPGIDKNNRFKQMVGMHKSLLIIPININFFWPES